MKEKTLESVVSLFALVANYKQGKGFSLMTSMIEMYLASQFSHQTTEWGLEVFSERLQVYDAQRKQNPDAWKTFFESELDAKCYILSREIDLSQRLLLLIYVMEFLPHLLDVHPDGIKQGEESGVFELFQNIALQLHIPGRDFVDSLAFVQENYQELSGSNNVLIITDNPSLAMYGIKVRHEEHMDGQAILLELRGANAVLLRVSGEAHFEMNGRQIYKRRTYLMSSGSVLVANNIKTFYFNDLCKWLEEVVYQEPLTLELSDLEYLFERGDLGIHKLHLKAESGELLAVMGGSGSGKTTLMSLMTGLLKPQNGTVRLNGTDVWQHLDKVRPHIGYVPQEDSLNGDLTAFDNLFYTASLCLSHTSASSISDQVDGLLKELDLMEIRDLKVGSPLKKVISGGQRKRLNIALELIRDPGALFLDEPTSGLSSSDSENVMKLLKEYALKGRLVVVNIHQPSSVVFKLFDNLLLLDKGGRAIYHGPAMRVNSFLKKALRLVDSHQSECQTCGNLNPDEIFDLVQKHKISPEGGVRPERQITPERWHRHFLRVYFASNDGAGRMQELPKPKLKLPSLGKQFLLHSIRNAKTKVADRLTFVISLTLPPFLGLLLSFFTKNVSPNIGHYVYAENRNIPAFVFISVIVAVFVGLMSSSQEIIKDRGTLKRESFLSLSYQSYIFAKMFYLLVLSGIQMCLYTVVSAMVLDIPYDNGMLFFILWATAVSSNAMGLLLSSIFNTVASVYISIPLVIIPQIMLAGAVISYDNLNPTVTSNERVPWVAEAMVSRWAYEGMCVSLFVNNDYSRRFYPTDQALNDVVYVQNFLIPELEEQYFGKNQSTETVLTADSAKFLLVENGLAQLKYYGFDPGFHELGAPIEGYPMMLFIEKAKNVASERSDSLSALKDSLIERMGRDAYTELRNSNFNKKLSDFLTHKESYQSISVDNDRFVREFNPIYDVPKGTLWRGAFFSPAQRVFGKNIPTQWYNLFIILLQTGVLLVLVRINKVGY